ncbi:MAG: hypothetical protein MK110_04800 [Fuerstiella sp.]|nr:hypothetical protein [Fuerstiella sp.]
MAKKSRFNMSAEVRTLLKADNNITGPQVYAALCRKAPNQTINKNSCGVAFANARKKMGLTRRSKKKIGTESRYERGAKSSILSTQTISLAALRCARELLAKTDGDVTVAAAVLHEVKALQKCC